MHPAKRATFLERLLRKREEIEIKFSKKNFKKFLPVRNRSCSFAPASRDAQCALNETKKRRATLMCDFKKKIRHVPRHIELTAVSSKRRDKRIRVIESRDLKKPLDLQSNTNEAEINSA